MKIEAAHAELAAEGVAHLALFGSRARGDHGDQSDMDVLIEIVPGHKFSILHLVKVEELLSKATGLPANAFMRRSLDKSFRSSIEKDIIEVF